MSPQNSVFVGILAAASGKVGDRFWACLAAAALLQSASGSHSCGNDAGTAAIDKGNPADTWRWHRSYALWKGGYGCCSYSNVTALLFEVRVGHETPIDCMRASELL